MENVVERIHRDFSFDLMDAVRETNEASLLHRIKPDFVDERRFADRVEYYRTHYPSYNFVTEKQIEDICLKYGLAFGSLMMFSGRIPMKNRLEISRFCLLTPEKFHENTNGPGKVFDMIRQNGCEMNVSFPERGRVSGGNPVMRFRSGYKPANPDAPFSVVPVGEHITLIQDIDPDKYRVYMDLQIYDSPWTVQMGMASHKNGSVHFEWRMSQRIGFDGLRSVSQMESFAEVHLSMPMEMIGRASNIDLSTHVSPMIVADPSMFKRHGDAVEKVGHRMKFKRSQAPASAVFSFVDDPIILQPVPFGFLVVTKWGAESRIGEIQNPTSN